MQYANFVTGDDDSEVLHAAPVPDEDADYLRRAAQSLRPMSDEEYMTGPAAILHTLARYSYVLDGDDLYWLIEWQPGLIVLRFSPHGSISWTAVRSPVPNFGGREASDADWDTYDEDAPNSQYHLIFRPWDAQFDAQEREWYSFAPAADDVQTRFQNALAHVNALGEVMEQRYANDEGWFARCKSNLATRSGDGVRLL